MNTASDSSPFLEPPQQLPALTTENLRDGGSKAPVLSMIQDPFLNTEDACGYIGVPKATLLTWRVRRPGYGPRAIKAGGRLKYRLSELDRWICAHEESLTDEETPTAARPDVVRTRNRASRVRGAAMRAARPNGIA